MLRVSLLSSKLSHRHRFALVMALLIVSLTLGLGFLTYSHSAGYARILIERQVTDTAFQMADKLDRSMEARINEVRLVSSTLSLSETGNPQTLRRQLETLQSHFDVVSWIGVTDAVGEVRAATGGILEGKDISHRPVFLNAREQMWIGDVHDAVMLAALLPNPSGEPIKFVDIATPLYQPDGAFDGVLAVHFSWEWASGIEASMIAPVQQRYDTDLVVVSADNTVLLGPHDLLGSTFELSRLQQDKDGNNARLLTWPDGHRYLTGWALSDGEGLFEGLGWTVLARVDEEVAFQPIRKLQLTITLTGVVLAMIITALGYWIMGRMASPLMRLSRAADHVRQGSHARIPREDSSPELLQLSVSMQAMVERLTSQQREIDSLSSMAHTDRLTGLPNRAFLESYLARLGEQIHAPSTHIAMMFLDLDGLKQINDVLGHHAGDMFLMESAKRLSSCLRPDDLAARLGGDEFIAVINLNVDAPYRVLSDLCERVLAALTQPIELSDGGKTSASCSIGVALWPDHSDDMATVMKYADEALYDVKRTKKGRFAFYQPR